ncbi:MAG TPA: cupredoxin domain-containing protein [Actinomycetota bacterium]
MRNGSSSMRRALVVVAVFGMLALSCSKQASARTAGAVTVREGPGNGYTFAPSTVTVNRGQLITVDNVSQVPHTFTVTGHGIDVETQSGKTSQITIDLPPGTYPFICRFHVSLGMKGTLVVR